MKKIVTILPLLLMLAFTAKVEAQVSPAEYDTLFHAQVGPGMYHTEYKISSVPWHIQVLEMEINQPGLEFRTVKATNRLTGLEKPSVLKESLEDGNTHVVGGVNGDFFGGGIPVNAQVIDGELMKQPYPRELIAFDNDFMPWIATTNFTGEVINGDTSEVISGINEERGENQIIAYNRFFGSGTETNEFGTEIAVKLEGTQRVNSPSTFVVTRIEENEGDMQLENDDMILSAHGTSTETFDGLGVDDTLTVQLNLNNIDQEIIEAVGGSTQFVKDGVVNSNWEERHPRTAVGFSQDTTIMYFVVVDGRQSTSAGMMLSEMGDFMVNIGVAHAINLDGGGSSALLVQDEVANNPSDGGSERSVANALFATIPDPGVGETERIQLRPGFDKVFLGKNIYFSVFEFDQNHRFSEVSASDIEFSADENLGTINSNGKLTAAIESDTGYVYATYGNFVDSARIILQGADRIELHPRHAALDTGMTLTPTFKIFDVENNRQTISRTDITWSLTDSEAGELDEEGNYTPQKLGEVGLIASFDTVSDTIWTDVQENEGFHEISTFSNTEDWNISTEDLNEENVSLHQLEDENGVEIRFTYPPQNVEPHIFLENSIAVSGVPGFANVVSSSDGENYVLTADIETEEEGRFRMSPPEYANNIEPEVMHFTFEQSKTTRITSGSRFYFPFSIESVNIRLPKNQTDEDIEGYFRFHSLGISYTDTPVSIEEEKQHETPDKIELDQNYPNPFNPTTQISFSIPTSEMVHLEVYDVLGRKVATLVNERLNAGTHMYNFDAAELSSGIYLYRLKTDQATLSRKMMLIK